MLWILVSSRTVRERFEHREGPLEFGRGPERDVPRRVLQDPTVSTNQLCVEQEDEHRVRLRNLSTKVTIRLADGSLIDPGGERLASLPARLQVGETLIEIEAKNPDGAAADAGGLRTIRAPVGAGPAAGATMAPHLSQTPGSDELARWFESLIGVQRAAASSPDFFAQTARAVVELIGLDSGFVLLRRDGDWDPLACYPPQEGAGSSFSRWILETVVRERRTFYQSGVQSTAASLVGVTAVVVSPILDEAQEVIGVVYGARRGAGPTSEISPLEAQLTQVLAAAVAAGLARLESEAQAARRRVQFEQFFTPDLAAALDRDPALLDGSEREVSVLFADIRGFSAVSEKMPPRLTCELIRDIMEHLTALIMDAKGVVVDYIGDGLLAMWNAPLEQPEHAAAACRAALAMRDGLPELNRRWESRLGKTIGLGIGLNSGPALVGNTGSHKKFKYGPLGHTVNLASRVEGATKHLGVSLLITGWTRAWLGEGFATRRLCRARVVGIAGEVELHELHAESASADWQNGASRTSGRWRFMKRASGASSAQAVFPLLTGSGGAYDLPSLTLLGRAVECLKAPPSVSTRCSS